MSILRFATPRLLGGLAIVAMSVGSWQASVVLAETPTPNPLAAGPSAALSPLPGVDVTGTGLAATMHGNPAAGRTKFASNCASCHGAGGTVGITNPGSDDGTVPALNPIDASIIEDSNGDAAIFARDIDPFLQHGSRPAGKSPLISMSGFGDHKLLSQSDIADIEAYVMELNATFWPDRCPGIRLELANPSPGARVELGGLIVQGQAVDVRAQQGSGIARIDFFLDSRDSGGTFVGTTNPALAPGPAGPASFQATLSLPSSKGEHNLVAYAHSAVNSQEAMVSIPIALGENPSKALEATPASGSAACVL